MRSREDRRRHPDDPGTRRGSKYSDERGRRRREMLVDGRLLDGADQTRPDVRNDAHADRPPTGAASGRARPSLRSATTSRSETRSAPPTADEAPPSESATTAPAAGPNAKRTGSAQRKRSRQID